jgi:hypothetical protein
MKYNLGTIQINSDGTWVYPKNIFVNQNGTWVPVKKAYVKKSDSTWERIWPIPMGTFTSSTNTLSHKYYQNYSDSGSAMTITNTGDFDLTINSVVINDFAFTTDSSLLPTFPLTLAPGASTPFKVSVTENTIGTYNGNIQFVNYTGYLGYANTVVNHTVTVLPDYNGIGLVGTNPTVISYLNDGSTTHGYSGYGSSSFTVPFGVTSLTVDMAGGGGGGGGNDSHAGAPGFPGHALTGGTISVTQGDTISIHVGGGGERGYSGGPVRGGYGGASDIGYNGGSGGSAGSGGWSGSGGGGGAATVILKNSNVIAIAAGGGGGGGGGNYSNGYGQLDVHVGGTAGQDGANKGGRDGAGGGGGGGGGNGGVGGPVGGYQGNGDLGAYSGADGTDSLPSGASISRANNAGGISISGGDGYAVLREQGINTNAAQNITLKNTGNGASLYINSLSSQNGLVQIYDLSNNLLAFNGTAQFTIAPLNTLSLGTHQDYIIVDSTASDYPIFKIPVTISVQQASGSKAFTTPGKYSWTVPPHVHSINLFAVGGGAGGGQGLTQYGGGGGGGSGGYSVSNNVTVTPGETLSIVVGAGGSNIVGLDRKVFAVSNPNWVAFLNNYGVWVSSDGVSPVGQTVPFSRMWTAPYTGNYTLYLSTDNAGSVNIDGAQIGSYGDFHGVASFSFSAAQGNRVVTVNALNYGGPGGIGAAILDSGNNVIWHTRQVLDPGAGQSGFSTTVSGSFGTITVGGGSPGSTAQS